MPTAELILLVDAVAREAYSDASRLSRGFFWSGACRIYEINDGRVDKNRSNL